MEMELERRILKSRIQPVPLVFMILTVGMLMPLAVQASNEKKIHTPTIFFAYGNLLFWLCLFGLVYFRNPSPRHHRPRWYIAIKVLLHACVLWLVSLSFSLSLMMSMNVLVTFLTLAMAAAVVARRLWQCAKTGLRADVNEYKGCEEVIQQLVELSTTATSSLLGGWYGMAFFYFQNYPEEARDARFIPSEYLTFFTSVAVSLVLVKAVPRTLSSAVNDDDAPEARARPGEPRGHVLLLIGALYILLVGTALVIAASKVGRYAALALVPEAVALVVLCVKYAWPPPPPAAQQENRRRPRPENPEGQAGDGQPPYSFLGVPLAVLLGVLSYRVKDVRALSTLYDEVFVLLTAAAVVAALSGRLLAQLPPGQNHRSPAVQAAATCLMYFAFGLLLLSVLAFPGVMFGW
ncbi:unnamed protein product [Urochloa decumbens]|uniref:Uncharacterized protein n=1 Tax=Urochloa decumbens TaxID=240449 RepID=A0ABC9E2L7_9POAL